MILTILTENTSDVSRWRMYIITACIKWERPLQLFLYNVGASYGSNLPMQSMLKVQIPSTTKVYLITFCHNLRHVDGFLQVMWFLQLVNVTAIHYLTMDESRIRTFHHASQWWWTSEKSKCNLFSPRYSWKIAHLVFNNKHSLINSLTFWFKHTGLIVEKGEILMK